MSEDELTALRPAWQARFEALLGLGERHELVRFMVLRLLGLVYVAAFASLVWQVLPLIGEQGITPAHLYLERARAMSGGLARAFWAEPSLFHFVPATDRALYGGALLGLTLSVLVLCGLSNALIMLLLWVLYRSYVVVGQLWYGYGWELLLVESGFLALFLCPLTSVRAFPKQRAPLALIWLFRWLACRVMLGAGLIKLRGDPCWTELTCLDFHFETQPLPNPLSPYFHALPHWLLAGGVLFNHLAELIAPLCIFGPRRLRVIAAWTMLLFQGVLISSGNLSFLNWLTLVPLLACCDDRALAPLLPRRLCDLAGRAVAVGRLHARTALAVSLLVLALSFSPVENMLSAQQRMNAAFEPFMLVNSYGAFGGVGRERRELIIEGTRDPEGGPEATWLAYELPCKPGDVTRAHPVISPLQPRLDWQIWFAAMASAEDEPWLLHVVWKLLQADRGLRSLLKRDPFGDVPPRFVRIMRYRYRFAPLGSGMRWQRELEGYWLPPLPADEVLRDAMIELGYLKR